MFIENRIRNKRNETDSCILRKTCYKILVNTNELKRFFRTIEVGKQFRQHYIEIYKADKTRSKFKNQKVFLIYNPRITIICDSSSKIS